MKEQEAEQKREQMGESDSSSSSGSSGRQLNPNREPGGGGKAMDETTVYHNTSYGPDENPNEGVGDEIQEKFGE